MHSRFAPSKFDMKRRVISLRRPLNKATHPILLSQKKRLDMHLLHLHVLRLCESIHSYCCALGIYLDPSDLKRPFYLHHLAESRNKRLGQPEGEDELRTGHEEFRHEALEQRRRAFGGHHTAEDGETRGLGLEICSL